MTTTSAFDGFDQVLANAGANIPIRDAVDERVNNGVRGGTGTLINHSEDVGGWPFIPSGSPPADTDRDGMPDAWENLYGFDPNDGLDGPQDADGDGYNNSEEFLNGLVPAAPQVAPTPLPEPTATPSPQPTATATPAATAVPPTQVPASATLAATGTPVTAAIRETPAPMPEPPLFATVLRPSEEGGVHVLVFALGLVVVFGVGGGAWGISPGDHRTQ